MALKLKITKEQYNALSDGLKTEYKEGDNEDEYVLDVEDLEDTGALKRAKDREKEAKKAALTKIKELEDKISEMEDKLEEGSGDKKDTDKVASAWERKYNKAIDEHKRELETLQGALQEQTRSATARALAAELAGDDAEIILPHIERRLRGELKEGRATTVVLDEDGEPGALTVEELKKEFLSNKKFSGIIVGSRGSGGGANGDRAKGAGGGAPKKLSEMSATEEAQFANSYPEEYKQMLAETSGG